MLNSSLKKRVRRLEVQRTADDYTPLSAIIREARELLACEDELPLADREAMRQQREAEWDRRALAALNEPDLACGQLGSAAYWGWIAQQIRRDRGRRLIREAQA